MDPYHVFTDQPALVKQITLFQIFAFVGCVWLLFKACLRAYGHASEYWNNKLAQRITPGDPSCPAPPVPPKKQSAKEIAEEERLKRKADILSAALTRSMLAAQQEANRLPGQTA